MKVYKAPFIGRGVTLLTPSSLPASVQAPTWNTNGTFAGWATATVPDGVGSEIQIRSSSTAFGAVTGSSWATDVLTVPTLAVSDLTATRIPYVGTAGRLVDSANLTTDGTQLFAPDGGSDSTPGISFTGDHNTGFRGNLVADYIHAICGGSRYMQIGDAFKIGDSAYPSTVAVTTGQFSVNSASAPWLELNNSMYYDIQMLASGIVTTLTSGTARVVYDVTRNIA